MESPDLVLVISALISIFVYRIIVNLCRVVTFVSPSAKLPPEPDIRNSYKWYTSFVVMVGLLFKRIFYFDSLRKLFIGLSPSMITLKLVCFFILIAFVLYVAILWFLGKLEPLAVQIEVFKSNVINQFLFRTIGTFNKVLSSIVLVRGFWLLITELGSFGIFQWRIFKTKQYHRTLNVPVNQRNEKTEKARERINQDSIAYKFLEHVGINSDISDRDDLIKEFYEFKKQYDVGQSAPIRTAFAKLIELLNSLVGQKDFIEFVCYVLLGCYLLSTAFDTKFLLSVVGDIKSTDFGITAMQLLGIVMFVILIIIVILVLWGETVFKKINFTDRKLDEFRPDPAKLEFKYLQRYLNDPSQTQLQLKETDLQHALKTLLKDLMGAVGIPTLVSFIITFMLCFAFLWIYWASRDRDQAGREQNMVDLSQLMRGSNLTFFVVAAIGFCLLVSGAHGVFVQKNQNKIFYILLIIFGALLVTSIVVALVQRLVEKVEDEDEEDDEI